MKDQLKDVTQLRHALKAMSKSVNQAFMTGTYEGTGDLLVRNYQKIYEKALQVLPDDYFIETLSLEDIDSNLDDRGKVSQVQMVVNQMLTYMAGMIREEERNVDVEDLKNLGGELRDQIIRMTKNTLRNALSNIDFDLSDEYSNDKPKRKIKIQVERDSSYTPPEDDLV
jgi:hypothetical protein